MPKSTLTRGMLSRSGRDLSLKIRVSCNCPDCGENIIADLYSPRFTAILRNPKFVGASSGCKKCGGWILVKLVNGFPTQREIDDNAEIDIQLIGPEQSP